MCACADAQYIDFISTKWYISTKWNAYIQFPGNIPLRGNAVYIFYNFRTDWNFLMKFCSFDPSFNRNILRSLYLKFKPSVHAHITITYHFVLFTNFWS